MSEANAETTPPADLLLSDAEKRRRVEAELSRLGMTPAEVHRLLSADANSTEPTVKRPVSPAPPATALVPLPAAKLPTPTPAKGRVTADSLQSFAAELMAQKAAVQVQELKARDLNLPEFRESSVQERLQSEAIQRDAATLKRREKFVEAEEKVRAALSLVPKDAAALEMLGDILQSVGRVDEALAAYKRATDADARRASAEKKYADLVMMQQKFEVLGEDDASVSPFAVVLLSALFPGFGHFLLRDWSKGAFFTAMGAFCVWLLAWSPWGFGSGGKAITFGLIASAALSLVVYASAMIDASVTAKRDRQRFEG